MTLAHLISSVNSYLQTDFPAVENHPLLSQGDSMDVQKSVDELIVRAANSARRWAEMRHDFQCASVTVDITIPAGGSVDLDDLNGVTMKIIENVYLEGRPINLMTNKDYWTSRYEQQEIQSSCHQESYYFENKLLLKGRKLSLSEPSTEDCNITVVGYEWMADYSSVKVIRALTTQPPNENLKFTTFGSENSPFWPSVVDNVEVLHNVYRSNDPEYVIIPKGIHAVTRDSDYEVICNNIAIPFTFESITFEVAVSDTLSNTDWFLQRGFEYMQWACIVEVNHLLQTFVNRQEGSLSPPERLRERAYEALKVLDMEAAEGGIRHE